MTSRDRLQQRIKALSPEQQQAFEARLRRKDSTSPQQNTHSVVVPVSDLWYLPLQHSQSRSTTLTTHHFTLDESLSKALKDFAQVSHQPLFLILLATFQILLHRYTDQPNLSLSVPLVWQMQDEMVTAFRMLPFESNYSGTLTFSSFLENAKQALFDAYTSQQAVGENKQVLSTINTVVFILHNTAVSISTPAGVKWISLNSEAEQEHFNHCVHAATTRSHLVFSIEDRGEKLQGSISYQDLIDSRSIERLSHHYIILARQLVAKTKHPVERLPMIGEAEYQHLIGQGNTTHVAYDNNRCVHLLVSEQAQRYPDSVAVEYADIILTYADLNSRAEGLADRLRLRGIGPEVVVAICVPRSPDSIISQLAVMKAGGVFVLLDPTEALTSLTFKMADCSPAVLIAYPDVAVRLGEHPPLVDPTELGTTARGADTMPHSKVTLNHAACIIYTSDDTERPHGVIIEHHSLTNLVHWHRTTFSVMNSDRAAWLTGVASDIALWEIWPYLAAGATVVIAGEVRQSYTNLKRLYCWLQTSTITMCFLPTPLAEDLFVLEQSNDSTLRVLFTGRDRLVVRAEPGESCMLVNTYGLAEGTIITTFGTVLADSKGSPHSMPSQPIDNVQIYVLDQCGNPVPPGVSGELYLGGRGVARGYLHRPELTAARFVPDPYGQPETHLFKTGDIVRYRYDGTLEYLRRSDEQVVHNGVRIFSHMVEILLSLRSNVKYAFAITTRDAPQRLGAFIVPHTDRGGSEPSVAISPADDRVEQWQVLFDKIYTQATVIDGTFNTAGWNSSYTGHPIPQSEMKEWVERTLERIRALKSRRIMEIGCGTGLLLFGLAPMCEQYLATDNSPEALAKIAHVSAALPQVTLERRAADNFTNIMSASFDAVVVNSVIQYFPSESYLQRVLTGAAATVKPEGHIFIGDVRSLPLLWAFHLDVELSKAADDLPIAQLRELVNHRSMAEAELNVDPLFFHHLVNILPGIKVVEVKLRRGQLNELTRFRYDVILQFGENPVRSSKAITMQWKTGINSETVRAFLAEHRPSVLCVIGVPDARVTRLYNAVALLNTLADTATVREIRQVSGAMQEVGVDPEVFWQLAENTGYHVEVYWSASRGSGFFDVSLRDHSVSANVALPLPPSALLHATAHQELVNDPLFADTAKKLSAQLRLYFKEHLSEMLLPDCLVIMKELPLTSEGNVDRQALMHQVKQTCDGTWKLVLPQK